MEFSQTGLVSKLPPEGDQLGQVVPLVTGVFRVGAAKETKSGAGLVRGERPSHRSPKSVTIVTGVPTRSP